MSDETKRPIVNFEEIEVYLGLSEQDLEEFSILPLEPSEITELNWDEVTVFEPDQRPEHSPEEILKLPNRCYAYSPDVDDVNQKSKKYQDKDPDGQDQIVENAEEANLITSQCGTEEGSTHAPVIDIDIPVELYPSSQIGHYHLYINKEMSWNDYCELLIALAKAGIVEEGYANASIARGYSAVRLVDKTKPNAPTGSNLLKENSRQRQMIYELRRTIEYVIAKRAEKVDWELVDERDKVIALNAELHRVNQELGNQIEQMKEQLESALAKNAETASITWS